MFSAIAFTALAALLNAHSAHAYCTRYCYNNYGGRYCCARSGLSTGARIAIGVCIGVGVFLIFMILGMLRRRKMQKQMAQYRPPMLPQPGQSNPYANNPPPPPGQQGFDNPYGGGMGGGMGGGNPMAPPNTYQPNTPYGQYRSADGSTGGKGDLETAHSYEYEQAAQNQNAPPGYDSSSPYPPPSGPPPSGGYAAPSGPPPPGR